MVVRCMWSSNIERNLEQGSLQVKGMRQRERGGYRLGWRGSDIKGGI